jgi:signal transduction histidine kinase
MGHSDPIVETARVAHSSDAAGWRRSAAEMALRLHAFIMRSPTAGGSRSDANLHGMSSTWRTEDLLAIACHELRTPLACAGHAVQLLAQPAIDAQTRDLAHELLARQLRHMNHLVEDLLAASQGARTPLRIQRTRLDLRTVVKHAIDAHAHAITAQGHDLTSALPDAPAWVSGDVHRLEQVFGNLLGNAAKYTRSGGHISVWMHLRQDRVVVRIRDTGVGIAPALLPRIFGLYWQADGFERSHGTGLGIGLAVVRELVQMHGGSVTAASGGAGCGSEFTVWLPQEGVGGV